MTYEDFIETIKKVSFGKLPIRCSVKAQEFVLTITTEDSSSPQELEVTMSWSCHCIYHDMTQLDAIRYVRERAREWMLHELDEHFMFKGERLFYPHKAAQ